MRLHTEKYSITISDRLGWIYLVFVHCFGLVGSNFRNVSFVYRLCSHFSSQTHAISFNYVLHASAQWIVLIMRRQTGRTLSISKILQNGSTLTSSLQRQIERLEQKMFQTDKGIGTMLSCTFKQQQQQQLIRCCVCLCLTARPTLRMLHTNMAIT